MQENFVTFDLAKKLTLKGFNAPCIAYYDEGFLRYNTKYPFVLTAEELLISHNSEHTWIDAPTISQVLKWLREEKRLHVIVATFIDQLNRCHNWGYEIWDISGYPKTIRHAASRTGFDDHDKSVLAGIEYCLDNLI